MARHFTLQGAEVLVLEKAADILDGASKGNSAILHTGFDAPPGSLEQSCIQSGYEEYLQIKDKLNLPVLETGALVVAWNSAEVEKLDGIVDRAKANGVWDTQILTTRQLMAKQPGLSRRAVAAVEVPGEFVIDPWTTPYTYLIQAIENGAVVLRNAEVLAGTFDQHRWTIESTQGKFTSKTIINCAGLYGDMLDDIFLGRSGFQIHPRKGQFLVFDKSAARLIDSIILPVPDEITKGVVVCRTIFGNLLVGPTAEDQHSRDEAAVDSETLRSLYNRALEIVPELAGHGVTATYAGIRPASEFKDYCVQAHNDKNYISVGGIRSTGLSAALGIASYVYGLYEEFGDQHNPRESIVYPDVLPLAECQLRDWSKPGNGGIVCHCELVTRREIEQALEGPLAVNSLSGLKRRTRATMGRCQGFYCSAELGELCASRLQLSISEAIE
ncbi:MAG: NAD(P)/FAD-dependent oxidoreductase [Gammaproteobacteria bacterium]|nr:NAD(P)/FAD-dependent oxidoreductase [Gammaproteobacteria bacterium]